MTPNIFAAYVTHGKSLDGGPAPKWQPVDTLTVTLESGEVLTLQRQAHIFETDPDLKIKVITHYAYHEATNTIYYYAPGPVAEAPAINTSSRLVVVDPAEWLDPADWQLAHPGESNA